jgi:hypothetical protein
VQKLAMALVVFIGSCKGGSPSESSSPPREVTVPASADAPASVMAGSPPAASKFYSLDELVALGLHASRLDAGETLLCEAGGQCICLKPLDCSSGGCISYDENVAAFRAALKNPGPGRTLSCGRAEIGRCDSFRYLDFEGDVYRRELRWFDEAGALVAQRNVSDHDAYCGEQTRTLYTGKVPRCEKLADADRICGDGKRPAMTALQDLRRFTAPRAQTR